MKILMRNLIFIATLVIHQLCHDGVQAYPSVIVQQSRTRCMTVQVAAMETVVVNLKSNGEFHHNATLHNYRYQQLVLRK